MSDGAYQVLDGALELADLLQRLVVSLHLVNVHGQVLRRDWGWGMLYKPVTANSYKTQPHSQRFMKVDECFSVSSRLYLLPACTGAVKEE